MNSPLNSLERIARFTPPAIAKVLIFPTILACAIGAGCAGFQPVRARPDESNARHGSAIRGVAIGPHGESIRGALVAAVPLKRTPGEFPSPPAVLTKSGDDGTFALLDLPPGDYALTATAQDFAAAFRSDVRLNEGQTAAGLRLEFGAQGERISGFVRTRNGAPIAGAQVRASRRSAFNGDTFYAECDRTGRYTLTLPKAAYVIAPFAADYTGDRESHVLERSTALDFAMDPVLPPGEPAPPAVVRWIQDAAVRLETTEPRTGFDDLQRLGPIVGDARIVALGEATHGTREFFRLKHRIVEYLVDKLGFTGFAMEASFPESFDVNDYIQTGRGDPAKALASLYFWTHDTEEIFDLVEWMREYNQDPNHTKKVRFYGFDIQSPVRAVKRSLAYLKSVGVEPTKRARDALAILGDPYLVRGVDALSADAKSELRKSAASVLAIFDEGEEGFIRRSSEERFRIARQHAKAVVQFLDAKAPGARDRAMAENIEWIADREGEGSKIVVWAHNAHISKSLRNAEGMGALLSEKFGNRLLTVGMAFNEGEFRAMQMPFAPESSARTFAFDAAPAGSLDATLASAGIPLFALDLRAVPQTGDLAPVGRWFSSRLPTREVGAGFDEARAADFVTSKAILQHFDALVFVSKMTAARPTPYGLVTGSTALPSPRNLDFARCEDADHGKIPEGWTTNEIDAFDYRVGVAPERARNVLTIERARGLHYGETYAMLAQRIDATPYAGSRVRFKAAVRVLGGGVETGARLWVRARRRSGDRTKDATGSAGGAVQSIPPVVEAVIDPAIRDPRWQDREVAIDVPDDAEWIGFGVAFVGEGRASFDSVSFEKIEKKPAGDPTRVAARKADNN